ncbi:MAG TPA: class I adenylate-forming enzyme family protein [Beijerinckiaceae bacterium]|jgi:acyl-CoA synthetase (AMP-forming)/AMP-acid ligase II|nr:class I adenylate-forming enzyme family protein [Beijerinckiaceae bacterium]
MKDVPWLGGQLPRMRLEAHYGDRVIECFAERPRGLFDLFADAVRRNPEGEAIVFEEQRITWREVDRKVTSVVAALAQRGIKPGERIGLFVGNRPEFVITLFAAARLGAISVPLGIRQQRDEIAYALDDCGASALIHDADLAERIPAPHDLPSLRHRFSVGPNSGAASFELLLQTRGAEEPAAAGEEDTAVILYTSGTTGRPKGAMLTNLNVVNSALAYEHCMGLRQNERCLMSVPLSHVTGLIAGIAASARCACTLIIMPSFRAADFLALAAAERMTYTMMVPAMYNLCLLQPDFAELDLSAWRIGSYGGAPMPPATIAAFAERLPNLLLMNAYGATETTSPTTIMPPSFTATHSAKVGLPIPGAKVAIMDDNGSELPVGEVGEIWIGGASVVPGYWNNPIATQKEFTGGFWHSGDLGSTDPDGFVSVLDRKKDMLNRGGHKIYTAEVEAVLAAHEEVVESAVVGRPCPVLGERVHAYIVTRSAGTLPASLRRYLAGRLSDYKVPETMHLSTEPLPRNSNGKVLKRELRERLLRELAAEDAAP